MQILNCDNLINSCCSDYGLAKTLSVFSNILTLIQIIVPILLIVMAAVNIFQLVYNPDDKKSIKKVINKFIAAAVVFFIPVIVNAFLSTLPNSFEIYGCMQAAKDLDSVAKNNNTIYSTIETKENQQVITNSSDYEKGVPKIKINNNNNNNSNSSRTTPTGGDGILLIAGHSYPPYCSTGGLGDCRGKARSGYAEEDETRQLVKLIKSNLDNLGVKSDIANAILSGDTDMMNKSFFIESKTNSALFNKFNWDNYKFVLEVHFNATSSANAQGTLLCKKSSSYSTKADEDIVNAVIRHTGNKRLGDSIQPLNNVSYFSKRNIPIVYLETEFYDNASAMRNYHNHINEIAKDIALAIQKNYG